MNTEKLVALAAVIELQPEAFDMNAYIVPSKRTFCGAVACVAGTQVLIDPETREMATKWLHGAGDFYDDNGDWRDFDEEAHELATRQLGLTEKQGDLLFCDATLVSDGDDVYRSVSFWDEAMKVVGIEPRGDGDSDVFDRVGPKQAAAVLRGLAEGKVKFPESIN